VKLASPSEFGAGLVNGDDDAGLSRDRLAVGACAIGQGIEHNGCRSTV
jgi:hypothetical protein